MTGLLATQGTLVISAPESTVTRSLDFTPRALVLWWAPFHRDGVSQGNRGGIGFVGSGGPAGAIGWISKPGVARTCDASCADTAAIAGFSDAGDESLSLRAEVELDARGFRLQIGPCSEDWQVHFLALGGGSVQASVGWLTSPADSGPQRITTTLRPDLVLLASVGVDAVSVTARGVSVSVGAASSPGRQGGIALCSRDQSPPGLVAGTQRSDAAIAGISGDGDERVALGRLISTDQHGFTLDWTNPDVRRVLYLAIEGISSRVGSGLSPTKPSRQRVRHIGLTPRSLLCLSWGLGASRSTANIGRLSVGSATGREQSAVCWDICNTAADVSASHTHAISDRLILIPDTRGGEMHAAASLAGFDRSGLTLDWVRSDGEPREFLYVALGDPDRARWQR